VNSGQNAPVNPQQWAPLPPPPGPVGSRRRPWLLPALALAAVLVVGAVLAVVVRGGGGGNAAEPPAPMSTASATPTGSGTPAAQAPRFVTITAPCRLVPRPVRRSFMPPPMNARRAGPSGRPGQDGHAAGCRWSTANPQAPRQRALTVRVVLRADQGGRAGVDKATTWMNAARRTMRQRAGTSVQNAGGSVLRYGTFRRVPDVGEDAFAMYAEAQSAAGRTGSVTVWARYANAMFKVVFAGSDGGAVPLAETAAFEGATAAARAVVTALQGCTGCLG